MPMRYELMEWFGYDPTTGKLYWKKSPNNRIKVGKEAGTTSRSGHRVVLLNGEPYKTHRIIWTMYRGRPGNLEVLHDDGDPTNNRLSNLSLDTHAENMKNQKKYKNNTTGVTGVDWYERYKKWRARISVDKKSTLLGYFDSKEEAITARMEAKKKYAFHPDHGKEKHEDF